MIFLVFVTEVTIRRSRSKVSCLHYAVTETLPSYSEGVLFTDRSTSWQKITILLKNDKKNWQRKRKKKKKGCANWREKKLTQKKTQAMTIKKPVKQLNSTYWTQQTAPDSCWISARIRSHSVASKTGCASTKKHLSNSIFIRHILATPGCRHRPLSPLPPSGPPEPSPPLFLHRYKQIYRTKTRNDTQ